MAEATAQAETLNVVVASDDNYVQHLAVTLLSVVDHCREPKRLALYVLDAGISPDNRQRLQALFSERGVQLEIISPEQADVGAIPLKRYGRAALLRISIAELLPAAARRAVYLDCDIVVLDDLAGLAATELNDHPVAAVENLGHQPSERLGLEAGNYFNSGVLVIDLEQWRERGIGAQVLDAMQADPERLIFPDQDGLNAVLHEDWQRLPLRWNQQPATYSMLPKQVPGSARAREFAEAVTRPAVVHFLGRNKPWHYMTFHPLKGTYWHYLRQSPWRDYRYPDGGLLNRLKKGLMLEKQLKRWRRRLAGPRLPA